MAEFAASPSAGRQPGWRRGCVASPLLAFLVFVLWIFICFRLHSGKDDARREAFNQQAEVLQRRISAEQGESDRIRLSLARLYFDNKRYWDSIEEYKRLLARHPGEASLHYALGVNYERLQQFRSAEESLLEAIRLKPDYFDALFVLGTLYAGKSGEANARILFEAALKLRPESLLVLKSYYLLLLKHGPATRLDQIEKLILKLDPDSAAKQP